MPLLPRALFSGLFDDAAVFPPGDAPLDLAVAGHRRLRRGPDADLIGPLLLPPSSVPAAIDLAGLADLFDAPRDDAARPSQARDTGPLDIAIAARPGTPADEVQYAAQLAAADSRVELCAVEIGWDEGWQRLDLPAPVVVVELPRGTERALAITEIAIARAEQADTTYLAKFRTGATPAWPWPAEGELARAVQGAVAMEVPLKLTGGLHHAVRGTYAGQPNHGVLNVLAIVAAARAGRPASALQSLLAQCDPQPLIAALAALGPRRIEQLREDLPSYGCCTVTDPIGELTALDAL